MVERLRQDDEQVVNSFRGCLGGVVTVDTMFPPDDGTLAASPNIPKAPSDPNRLDRIRKISDKAQDFLNASAGLFKVG